MNDMASTNEPATAKRNRSGGATAWTILLDTALTAGVMTAVYGLARNVSHQHGPVADWFTATSVLAEKIGTNANALDLTGGLLVVVVAIAALANLARAAVASRFGRKNAQWVEAWQNIQRTARRASPSYLGAVIAVSVAAGSAGLPIAALTIDGAASILIYSATLLAVTYSSAIARTATSRIAKAGGPGPAVEARA